MRIVLDLQACQSSSRFRGIGRYSLALAQAIARNAGQHEIWIALNGYMTDTVMPIRQAFDGLVPSERVAVFSVPGPVAELDPANAWRARAAELVREHALAELAPDLVHLASLFEGWVDDVATSIGALDSSIATAATLYDLIPLKHSKTHLCSPVHRAWYFRKLDSLKKANLLLAISDFSKREAIAELGISPGRITNIAAGVGPEFRPVEVSELESAELFSRYGIARPFLLYTGNLEPHKNLEGAIRGFAAIPVEIRRAHQLVIVSQMIEEHRHRLLKLVTVLGMGECDVVLTGYVPEPELVLLYNLCKAFVFPSLYEGFGLPALEAMACGAPTIGSRATSIPEVIGRDDALFDPTSIPAIAKAMHRVLVDDGFRESLRAHARAQKEKFSWDKSARLTLEAISQGQKRSQEQHRVAVAVPTHRPRMAYVSPLPPERTGIADYSAELLPILSRHYEITVISDQPEISVPELHCNFPLRDSRWFDENARSFDRIIYHFGNSPFHRHMFALLERHPGVVVLHDFFLSSVTHWMEYRGYADHVFQQALYSSHGYKALLEKVERGGDFAELEFPVNGSVIANAAGVIVHSEYSTRLAKLWYGMSQSAQWFRVPFLRVAECVDSRESARRYLNIPEHVFLVCSFGFLGATKLNDRLLNAWVLSALAQDAHCQLIFVGEDHGGEYGLQMRSAIKAAGLEGRVTVTGFASQETYKKFLVAADVAVQLRANSRGETSAAIFDCLAQGLPLIVNAHGSNAELPKDVAVVMEDEFSTDELINTLEHLRHSPETRAHLSQSGREYINTHHSPEKIGILYRDAIEKSHTNSTAARYRRLVANLAALPYNPSPTDFDLAEVAVSIANNQPRFGLRQLLVDVSEISRNDLRTGIERVTRSIVRALIVSPPKGFRVEPIYRTENGFRYARCFISGLLGIDDTGLADDLVETQPGDIYLAAEWSPPGVQETKQSLIEMRARGVLINFLIFDILPLQFPRYFPEDIEPAYRQWLESIAEIADGAICISRSVAAQLSSWLEKRPSHRQTPMRIGSFHLGADIENSQPTVGLPLDAARTLEALCTRPTFLMVGTVEPRKGHSQALTAFEHLWAEGMDVNLAIVGKPGWKVESLIEQLPTHPENGKRLFWLQGISDEMLLKVYGASTVLLAASEGEGFGLPLIEAAQHGLPIIARDIPVFREVACDHAFYFSGRESNQLAAACQDWLRLNAEGRAPQSKDMQWMTWAESTQELVKVLIANN